MPMTDFDRQHVGNMLRDPQEYTWFTAHLFRLIAKADADHRLLLALGFPDEVAVVEHYLLHGDADDGSA